MKQKLITNNFEVIVNPTGAFVESLKFNSVNIIYPKKELLINDIKKDRGGSHICLPLFGPNDIYGLNRHGFGRELQWNLEEEDEYYLKYTLVTDHKDFKDIVFFLEYRILDNKFISILTAKNYSEEEKSISPAFHPYFTFDDFNEIKINGENLNYSNEELADTIYFGNIKSFETKEYIINFTEENLSKFVIWTDLADNYICLEPTFNFVKKDYYILKPNTEEKFYFEMEINKN